jgi:hypothetical protein
VTSPAREAFDWLFRNRETGEITVAQFPNLALWIFIGTFVLRLFGTIEDADGNAIIEGTTRTVVDLVGLAALAWWSIDEIWRGVNPWRRILGAVGALVTAAGLVGQIG